MLHRFQSFGLQHFAHHSGLGGYSKLLLPDLLPTSLNATILVDTDTIFVANVAPLWALRHRLERTGGVLAAKRLSTGGACLRGQRINSGVVLLDLARMRTIGWVPTLLTRVAALGRRGVPARQCGKMVRNNGTTLAAGDQELLSFGCLQAGPGACLPLPPAYHQDKCDGFMGAATALILHFNCKGSPSDCPTAECSRIAADFERQEQARPSGQPGKA